MNYFGRRKMLIFNMTASAGATLVYGWAITNGPGTVVVLSLAIDPAIKSRNSATPN